MTDQIRQRIASYFGYNAIGRIVFDPYYGLEGAAPAVPDVDRSSLTSPYQEGLKRRRKQRVENGS